MDTLKLLNLTVKQVMTTEVITVLENDTIDAVDEIIHSHLIHHVPVVDKEGKFKGILSKSDLDLMKQWAMKFGNNNAILANEKIMESLLAKDCMTKRVVTIGPDETLESCADVFKENLFHAMPVVVNGKLIGIITTYDLLALAYTKQPQIELT